jgi:alpha-galactosidase
MVPALSGGPDPRSHNVDFNALRRLVAQWRHVASYYYGDYYPLTTYTTDDSAWVAWQFDRPEMGDGVLQAFRRPASPIEEARFKLRGLDARTQYAVRNLDAPGQIQFSGQELIEKGLPVAIKDQPGAVIITYRQVKGSR